MGKEVVKKPTGGPSDYYLIPKGSTEIQDLIEYKNMGFSLGNILKACWRFGTKEGTSDVYDARKIIYFGCRILYRLTSKQEVVRYLQELIDSKQFQDGLSREQSEKDKT